MVTSEYTSSQAAAPSPSATGRQHGRAEDGAHAESRRLIDRAEQLQLRAPELSLVLAQRAASLAESVGSNALWVRAEALVVLANIRLGHRVDTAGRAAAALRAAEDAGERVLAVRLRNGLAVCARSVGVPLTGLTILRPALNVAGVPGAQRAGTLSQLAGCVAGFTRKSELDKLLTEGDRLCAEDGTLDHDGRLIQRAVLRVGMSAHRRRHGDLVGAADAARTGIGFLDGLAEPATDGGVARVRLILELVNSLLDRGETAVATDVTSPILGRPLRAAEVAPFSWLRLAVATRVHLPAGEGYAAAGLLREAVQDTHRYGMRALSARLNSELSHVEERLYRPADALEFLRAARSDERAHARLRGRAYAVLTSEFGVGERPNIDFDQVLAGPAPAVTDGDTSETGATAAADEASVATEAPLGQAGISGQTQPSTQPSSHTASAEEPEPARGTRHAEQTPEAGGSVLDRLGISTGGAAGSGGRRRAIEAGGQTEERDPQAEPPAVGTSAAQQPPAAGPSENAHTAHAGQEESAPGRAESTDWLPRLRLPPSLAPVEEFVAGSGDQGSEDRDRGFRHEAGASPSDVPATAAPSESDGSGGVDDTPSTQDDPPADAGLAELLTRALAEHQAGTSSAAALVKRLGSGDDEPAGGGQGVNGRSRGDG